MTAKKASRTQMFGALVNSIAETNKSSNSGEATKAPSPRVGSGVVAATKESIISELREERDRLKAQLSDHPTSDVVELDPQKIDPSPFPDRLSDAATEEAILTLRQSISERGQEIPILVRPHPSEKDRYQIAYGHRRLKAVAGIPGKFIRAVVRDLSDAELVQAQGVENSSRQDLSFIERVLFAAHVRALSPDPSEEVARVKLALSITDAEASYLKRIHSVVPGDLIRAIGPAPKIGRPRWMKLAELLEMDGSATKATAVLESDTFKSEGLSDKRFQILLKALSNEDAAKVDSSPAVEIFAGDVQLGALKSGRKNSELVLFDSGFAEHVTKALPDLFEAYKKS